GTGYTVELKDADENQIACNTNTDLSEVIHIKSVGTASGQAQRSIEAAVAAGGSGGIIGGCMCNGNNHMIDERWGSGCITRDPTPCGDCSEVSERGYACGMVGSSQLRDLCICVEQ
ncbi:MAG: hypothetical protein WC120_05930, partial [Parcubacteria group bacterium]